MVHSWWIPLLGPKSSERSASSEPERPEALPTGPVAAESGRPSWAARCTSSTPHGITGPDQQGRGAFGAFFGGSFLQNWLLGGPRMTKRLAAGCGIENHTCLDLPLVQKKVFKVKFDTLFTKSSAKVRSTQKRALFFGSL